MANDGTSKEARQAWLLPLAGYGAAFLLNIAFGMIGAGQQKSRSQHLFEGLACLGIMLAFIIAGYFRSFQCLKGKRSVSHGVAGLIVSTLTLVAIVSLLVLVVSIANRQQMQPKDVVDAMARSQQSQLPVVIDDVTKLVKVHQDPDLVLNCEFLIHGVERESISPGLIDSLEKITRAAVKEEGKFKALEGTGAVIRYIYKHEDGTVLLDFTVEP